MTGFSLPPAERGIQDVVGGLGDIEECVTGPGGAAARATALTVAGDRPGRCAVGARAPAAARRGGGPGMLRMAGVPFPRRAPGVRTRGGVRKKMCGRPATLATFRANIRYWTSVSEK
ncbi:hypothetical protein GCM10020295_53670 [Streptomyces cinereospinus]